MLPEIAKKQDIQVDNRPYPVIAAGEGTLVVCLHGFPDNNESFQHQIEPFVAAGYRVAGRLSDVAGLCTRDRGGIGFQ
jgi:hypothetical protein